MALLALEHTIFYKLEKGIKNYRIFAQRNIKAAGFDITIDQALVLKTLHDHPEFTQKQVARMIFKDYASVTRIIELLVTQNCLTRSSNKEDRRRFKLEITVAGKQVLKDLEPIIENNRKQALDHISGDEVQLLNITLEKIIFNCQSALKKPSLRLVERLMPIKPV